MTNLLERDLTAYLDGEAARVPVRDGLADIEHGVTLVALRTSPATRRSPVLFVGAAAAVAAVIVLAAVRQDAPAAVTPAAVPPTVLVDPPTTAPPTTLAPETAAPPTTVLQVLPLPLGSRIQGIVPACTTPDGAVWNCTIPAFPEDLGGVDYTGYSTIVVDDTSHVSGGCRSASADATAYVCYMGQRAVDEDYVLAQTLGDWAPQGYIAG